LLTPPDRYRHWPATGRGELAWLVLDVDEQGPAWSPATS